MGFFGLALLCAALGTIPLLIGRKFGIAFSIIGTSPHAGEGRR